MNPILVVVRLLRGRLVVSLILAMLAAIPAGIAVFSIVSPVFTSQGIVQITPETTGIIGESPESQPLKNFGSFVSAQATFIGSRPVLERAIRDPELIRAGWPAGDQGISKLASSLSVASRDSLELIQVNVTDPNPTLARIAVDAVLRSYESLYINDKTLEVADRENVLDRLVNRLQAEIRHLQSQIEEQSLQYGADSLRKVHDRRVLQMEKTRELLQQIDLDIAQKKSDPAAETTTEAGNELMRMLVIDQQLDSFNIQATAIQQELMAMEERGLGEQHPEVKTLKRRLLHLQSQVRGRENQLKRLAETGTLTSSTEDMADPEEELERMVVLRDQLRESFQKLQQEVQDLGMRNSSIRKLQIQESDKKRDLDEAQRRLDVLRINTRNQPGRISVAVWGTKPTGPSNDKRVPYSVAAAGAAGFMGFILIPLLAYLRREYTYSDETDHLPGTEMLTVLPHIDRSNLVSQHRAEIAVQHLRNNLQLVTSSEHVVVSIVGSSGDEGVTSLVMALAVAMAESGSSVIVVDANLNNPDLTSKMSMSDRYGLREMMSRAEGPDLAQLSRFILGTSYPDVAVLPVGQDMTSDPQRLSMVKLKRLMEQLKRRFDVVLIDAGPLLGHAHAQLFASVAEQNVLMIRRQQSMSAARDAVNLIRRVTPQTIGLVFNDALRNDPGLRPIFPRESYLDSLPTGETFRERGKPSPMLKTKTYGADASNLATHNGDELTTRARQETGDHASDLERRY